MAWLAWAVLGFVLGVIFKLLIRTHGPAAWFAAIAVGIAGGVVGGWIGSLIWGTGVLDVRVSNLAAAIVGAIVLLAIYRYRWAHRGPGFQYGNPNAL